jgi:hypothetical protein
MMGSVALTAAEQKSFAKARLEIRPRIANLDDASENRSRCSFWC